MSVNIHNLIAAINPELYCNPETKSEIKKILQEEGPEKGYLKAAEKAKPIESDYLDFDEIEYKSAIKAVGLKNPIEKHELMYDAAGESLEPLYFWIIDRLQTDYEDMKNIDKLIDNFISSPGSGHFSEIGQKATRMQEEGMKIFSTINVVIKSILNIIYDLKEFKIRLSLYERYKSDNEDEKQSALLSLKQIWMDTVDFKRGNTAIKLMAQQFQYVTLIDAFMAINALEEVEKLDLNDRVKRIVQQRIGEFFLWVEESEKELRKRFEIEKIYLKTQVNTAKIYARWVKPYLKAAQQLEQRASPNASLVTNFNTSIFELTLLGEAEYDVKEDTRSGNLPKMFETVKARRCSPIIIIELSFRTIPERIQQGGYGFRGKVEIKFTSYALNEDELKLLHEQIERDDLGDMFKVIEQSTDESLAQVQVDLDELLSDKEKNNKKEKEQMKKESDDTNPFSALFSIFKGEKKKSEKKDEKNKLPAPDSAIEKVIRSQAILKARKECRKFYDLYKKEHNMPAF